MQEGFDVPGERLASTWGLTRQALAPAAQRGELFAVKVGNRLYDPQAFLSLDRQAVATLGVRPSFLWPWVTTGPLATTRACV